MGKAVSEGSTLYVIHEGRALYQNFVADLKVDQRDLRTCCQRSGDRPDGSKWQFFPTTKASLEGITALIALKRRMRERVLKAAEGFAERCAGVLLSVAPKTGRGGG